MTIKDQIISKCFAVYIACTKANQANVKWDETTYNKWDHQLDKAILELVRMIKDEPSAEK
jgi:hypothetical protein